jgi:hypothetical protein
MSSHYPLLYSYTPSNNTIYMKNNHCETKNTQGISSNIVNMSPHSTSSNINKPIMIFTKSPNTNVDNYNSSYGIPFECVELIRRILYTQCNYTFPSIVDTEEMFFSINALYNIHETSTAVSLKTYQFPYGFEYAYAYENSNNKIQSYLKPGTILFWKKVKNDDDFVDGHVAIIISANNYHVTIAQQNRDPPIEQYNTAKLVAMINREDSHFLGVKVLPDNLSKYLSHKLKNIQVKEFDE